MRNVAIGKENYMLSQTACDAGAQEIRRRRSLRYFQRDPALVDKPEDG